MVHRTGLSSFPLLLLWLVCGIDVVAVDGQEQLFCPTGRELYFDTFTDGTGGWSTDMTTMYNGTIGMALGPFGFADPPPSRTYSIRTQDHDHVRVEFDFLRLDSWDQSDAFGYDSFGLTVGEDEFVDIGLFYVYREEGNRAGTSPNGVSWTMAPKTGSINIENSNPLYPDQILIISLVIPSRFFADGSLKITMNPSVSQASNDEAAAFDNVRVSECGTPQMTYCSLEEPLSLDTFDEGDGGWSNAILTRFEGIGQFLGQYARNSNDPFKTFTVGAQDFVQIQFDFYKFDSWDATEQWGFDTFGIEINGKFIDMGRPPVTGVSGYSEDGILWIVTAKQDYYQIEGSVSIFLDLIHLVTIYVPRLVIPDGVLTVKLITNVNQGLNDESAGYDSFRVTGFDGCEGSANTGPLDPDSCRSDQQISLDTFDSGDDGWSNSRLSSLEAVGQYLGNYANSQSEPFKTFTINPSASFVKLVFDLIELDSWDATERFGYDSLEVRLNEESIDFGSSIQNRVDGIRWHGKLLRAETHLGSNSRYKDQIVQFEMLIPDSVFPDGTLKIQFHANVNSGLNDESAGFDNIKVSELSDCSILSVATAFNAYVPGNVLTVVHMCSSGSRNCGYCQGNCHDDSECPPGSTCFARVGFESVPGCSGAGIRGMSYCTSSGA